MRREELYLVDIVEAADQIKEFLGDATYDAFVQNKVLRSAVLHQLMIVGEAVARLPDEFRASHLDVEWADIAGFRNIVVHAYFDIEWPIVWIAATKETPRLRAAVAQIIADEYPDVELPQ